jgi:hypothetical protein
MSRLICDWLIRVRQLLLNYCAGVIIDENIRPLSVSLVMIPWGSFSRLSKIVSKFPAARGWLTNQIPAWRVNTRDRSRIRATRALKRLSPPSIFLRIAVRKNGEKTTRDSAGRLIPLAIMAGARRIRWSYSTINNKLLGDCYRLKRSPFFRGHGGGESEQRERKQRMKNPRASSQCRGQPIDGARLIRLRELPRSSLHLTYDKRIIPTKVQRSDLW